MEWYEAEVREIERLHAQSPPAGGAIVFYGSSSFRLWTTLAEDLAPWPVVNRAFGGSTLAACAHFFERLVPPCAPRSLVVYAGDNDLGDGQQPGAVIGSLHALLAKADARLGPIPVAFVSVKLSPARLGLRPAIERVNEAARQIITSRPQGLYIDVARTMLSADGRPIAALFADDGLHLSADGYRVWAATLRPYGAALGAPEA
jgi:lysophospholipase L1-like esterase